MAIFIKLVLVIANTTMTCPYCSLTVGASSVSIKTTRFVRVILFAQPSDAGVGDLLLLFRVEGIHLPMASDAGCGGVKQASSSPSKTVRPTTNRGARCMGHAEITWSAVCSVAPHLQFNERARPHLYIDE